MSMSRAQRVDEKIWVICQVIMFTPTVMVNKMSKMAHFFVFSADGSKKLGIVWEKYLNTTKKSYRVFSENGMVNRVWNDRS